MSKIKGEKKNKNINGFPAGGHLPPYPQGHANMPPTMFPPNFAGYENVNFNLSPHYPMPNAQPMAAGPDSDSDDTDDSSKPEMANFNVEVPSNPADFYAFCSKIKQDSLNILEAAKRDNSSVSERLKKYRVKINRLASEMQEKDKVINVQSDIIMKQLAVIDAYQEKYGPAPSAGSHGRNETTGNNNAWALVKHGAKKEW